MNQVMRRLNRRTLAGKLEELATNTGSRPAVFFEHGQLTYAELDDRARQIGRALRANGIGRGDNIGILLGNTPDWLSICFGAFYAGATVVPFNTWYKKTELDFTLGHCDITLLFFSPRFLSQDFAQMLGELMPRWPTQDRYPLLRKIVSLGDTVPGIEDWDSFLRAADQYAEADMFVTRERAQPDDIAFILYTSGSSAEPKGVMLNHRNVLRNGTRMAERRNIVADDRIWLGSPLFYGLGATNALPVVLAAGASLVLQNHFDAGEAVDLISRTQATGFYGTGNMARAMLDHPNFSKSKVSTLQKGNAGTTPQYKQMVLVELGVSQASSVYGLTESYGNATVGRHDDPLEVKINTCGTPLTGMEIKIVDPDTFRPVKCGDTGLVLIRGRTTPGYFRNPKESQHALLADGYLNTGDLGSIDDQGRFIFASRLKDVIKSGGINVSPLEVERILVSHPDIKDAHVVGLQDDARGEIIIAFITGDLEVHETEVQHYVKTRAASFKVPHHVFWRMEERLPRLASGKIDKRFLIEEAARLLESATDLPAGRSNNAAISTGSAS